MNKDYRDMLSALSGENADFMLVGAYAMAAYGLPRATGDMDIWIRRSPENAQRVWRALVVFGCPLHDLTADDLQTPEIVFQIGVAPRRIDIVTSIDGVEFEDAWPDRYEAELQGARIPVISRSHLVQNKRAAGRPKDVADVAWLESEEP